MSFCKLAVQSSSDGRIDALLRDTLLYAPSCREKDSDAASEKPIRRGGFEHVFHLLRDTQFSQASLSHDCPNRRTGLIVARLSQSSLSPLSQDCLNRYPVSWAKSQNNWDNCSTLLDNCSTPKKEEIPRPVAMRRTLQTGRWGTSAVGEPTQNQMAANFEGIHRERGGGVFPDTPPLSRRWVELKFCSTNKQNRSIKSSNAMFVPNSPRIEPMAKSMGDNQLYDAKLLGFLRAKKGTSPRSRPSAAQA